MRISLLRQRMIDDMTARHFSEKAQKDYIRCVKNLRRSSAGLPRQRQRKICGFTASILSSSARSLQRELVHDRVAVLSASRSTGTSFASPCSGSSSPGSCPRY